MFRLGKKIVITLSLLLTAIMIIKCTEVGAASVGDSIPVKDLSGTEITELVPDLVSKMQDMDLIKDYEFTFEVGEDELIIPVVLEKKGGLYIELMYLYNAFSSITVNLYEDAECTNVIGDTMTLLTGQLINEDNITVDKEGTYYLKLNLDRGDTKEIVDITFDMSAYLINGDNRTIKNDVQIMAYQDDGSDDIIYKLVVKNPGTIVLNFGGVVYESSESFIKSQLLDSKKKSLSKLVYVKGTKKDNLSPYNYNGELIQNYKVSAGTYYIKVRTIYEFYSFIYKFKADK